MEILKAGIDVSDNQGVIDWREAKADGVKFAIIRSVRGSGKTDYQFQNNVNGCSQNDIPFDIYKYSYADTIQKAQNEAKLVVDLLNKNEIDCTVWWDMEDKSLRNLGKTALSALIIAAKQVVEAAGFEFGIYCNKDWYKNVLNTADFNCRFWVAGYPTNGYMKLTDSPAEKYKPVITQELFGWQYSSHGVVNGISGNVDLNQIYQEIEEPAVPEKKQTCTYKEPTYCLYRNRLAMDKDFVKWLQWYLIQTGDLDEKNEKDQNNIDGSFGKRTEEAVKSFQLKHKETYSTKNPDMKVGKNTRKALITAI